MDPANSSAVRYASNATGATWALTETTPGDELARQVTVLGDDVTDHSLKTAILTGTDADGRPQTETINLPNGQVTVTSTKFFLTLTSVVPSATIGSDTMDIGFSDVIVSKTYPLNHWSDVGAPINVVETGTANFTAELTFDPPNRPAEFTWTDQNTPTWTASSNISAATATVFTTLDVGAYAMRMKINSYSDTAELDFWISQTESR